MFQAQLRSHVGLIHHICHWKMFPTPLQEGRTGEGVLGPAAFLCRGAETELRWPGRPVEGQTQGLVTGST